jgi:hypothetical protein
VRSDKLALPIREISLEVSANINEMPKDEYLYSRIALSCDEIRCHEEFLTPIVTV